MKGEDYEELIFTAERMRDYLNTQSISGCDELKIDVNKSKPGMQVLVDRKKAGELGCEHRASWATIKSVLFLETKPEFIKKMGKIMIFMCVLIKTIAIIKVLFSIRK